MGRISFRLAARFVAALACLLAGAGGRLAVAEMLSDGGGPGITEYGPSCDCGGCCDCIEYLPLGETICQSVFGCPDPNCWRPMCLSTLFSEGWHEAWVPSPNGCGGAPRQGWINAADGNMYRLMFFTFAQGFNHPPQGDAYLGAYTLLTPFSRRLMLITNIPFTMRNNVSGGLPTVDPEGNVTTSTRGQTTFGDVSFTPRVLLHETQDLSITFDFTVVTPTGGQPLAGKTAVTPTLAFWYNIAGGWVIRGGIGEYVPTDGSGGQSVISQLAIGQTITDHDVPLLGDFTYYVSAVANSPINSTTPTSVTLTPGMRTHLGSDWYFLAGLPTPVTDRRVADVGMIFWFMKAW